MLALGSTVVARIANASPRATGIARATGVAWAFAALVLWLVRGNPQS